MFSSGVPQQSFLSSYSSFYDILLLSDVPFFGGCYFPCTGTLPRFCYFLPDCVLGDARSHSYTHAHTPENPKSRQRKKAQRPTQSESWGARECGSYFWTVFSCAHAHASQACCCSERWVSSDDIPGGFFLLWFVCLAQQTPTPKHLQALETPPASQMSC